MPRNDVSIVGGAAAVSLLTFMVAAAVPARATDDQSTPSHCARNEQVIFSCKIKGSKKVLSVCAAKSLGVPERYLQYRYGAQGSLELEFPARRAQSVEQFKTAHYFRARVDRREVTFTNNDVQYTVFTDYEGEESPPQREAGVRVRKGSADRDEKTLQCAAPYINHLQALDNVVACDPNSPLSGGSCPH